MGLFLIRNKIMPLFKKNKSKMYKLLAILIVLLLTLKGNIVGFLFSFAMIALTFGSKILAIIEKYKTIEKFTQYDFNNSSNSNRSQHQPNIMTKSEAAEILDINIDANADEIKELI